MIALTGITLRLDRTYTIRPGQVVPAVVVEHWRRTGDLDRLVKSSMIADDRPKSKSKSLGKSTRVDKKEKTDVDDSVDETDSGA